MRKIRVWMRADVCQGKSGYQGAFLLLPVWQKAAARRKNRGMPEGGDTESTALSHG